MGGLGKLPQRETREVLVHYVLYPLSENTNRFWVRVGLTTSLSLARVIAYVGLWHS